MAPAFSKLYLRVSNFLIPFPLPQEHLLLLFYIFVWIWNSDWLNPKIFRFEFGFFEVHLIRSSVFGGVTQCLECCKFGSGYDLGHIRLNFLEFRHFWHIWYSIFHLEQRGSGSLKLNFSKFGKFKSDPTLFLYEF